MRPYAFNARRNKRRNVSFFSEKKKRRAICGCFMSLKSWSEMEIGRAYLSSSTFGNKEIPCCGKVRALPRYRKRPAGRQKCDRSIDRSIRAVHPRYIREPEIDTSGWSLLSTFRSSLRLGAVREARPFGRSILWTTGIGRRAEEMRRPHV